jgi:transcriptional regulator with XRE-family HTH domain
MSQQYTVAEAIRQARKGSGPDGRSLRAIAARAGVSAAQINRIENGQVEHPSAETLIAVARGLELNPFFLLVLSGHVSDAEARRRLAAMFQEGSEIQQEWVSEAAEIRTNLEDPGWPTDEIHRLAFTLFIGEPLWEVAWDDSFLLMASGTENEQMREIASLLANLIDERKPRVIEYLRDQVELSRRDLLRSYEADQAEVARLMKSGEWPPADVDLSSGENGGEADARS